jgi:hypothetical protein
MIIFKLHRAYAWILMVAVSFRLTSLGPSPFGNGPLLLRAWQRRIKPVARAGVSQRKALPRPRVTIGVCEMAHGREK